ncbi:MAG: S8 family serine peptidase, partial [Candidatus Hydrogenedentota bacterium]
MHNVTFVLCLLVMGMAVSEAVGQGTADTLDLSTPAARQAAVEAKRQAFELEQEQAEAVVRQMGGVVRGVTPDGRRFELIGIEKGRPVYYITDNENAAISTAADLVRNTSPYNVNGLGYTVGVWDGGAVLDTHQEFGGRVNVLDAVATSYHATHVAGTIGAVGVEENAQGMAPSVTIDSYDWNSDEAEMSARAATFPGEAGRIYLSNHSYGLIAGWSYGDWSGSAGYHWWGVWGEPEDQDFGRYDTSYAQDWDVICYAAPYFLPFKSSGNDRGDNAPSDGTTFYYLNGGWQSKSYVSGSDPAGDGAANGGYDTIGRRGVAKNIMTVGAVNDAVSSGVRDVASGTMASFSGWGPTDDGRVKPDIVANGVSLYSCDDDNDAGYRTIGGTSMSTPNASGSAALLVDYYEELFPGQAMRSSMLKGLIIHTADDHPASNAGPDYQFGWGLMHTEAAADHILQHSLNATAHYMSTGTLDGGNTQDSFSFLWNGVDAIRATLCWTDPAGPGQSGLDDTTPMLVNDLDLRIYGPGGAPAYFPYVLDVANPGNPATTGDNVVDNVEQVYIASPPAAGTYTVEVTYKGALTDDQQVYSLLLSGQAPDSMQVSPAEDYDAGGPMGGPFSPVSKDYQLTNGGGSSLDWSASPAESWLDVSPTSGTLEAGASATVTVSINATANGLAAGLHTSALTFTNVTSGAVSTFSVNLDVRPVAGFNWDAVSSPQLRDVPFGVAVQAVDSTGALVSVFDGTAMLEGFIPTIAEVGADTSTWNYPLSTYYEDARTQVIYLQSEVGDAGNIAALSLDVASLPDQTLGNWTIRMKHTALSSYSTDSWEGSGWTTVYQNDEVISGTGWVTFDFEEFFAYNGVDNLLVDFSFNNSSWSSDGTVRYSQPGGTRALYYRTDSNYGDPLDWSGTSNPTPSSSGNVPNVRLEVNRPVAIDPTATGNFTGGEWSGDIAVLEEAAGMHLRAYDGLGNGGDSNAFDVMPDNVPPNAQCQDITVVLSSPEIVAQDLDDGSTDNIGIVTWLVDGAPTRTFTCGDAAASPVTATLRVEDAEGNWDECTATVTVVDDVGPEAVCQDVTVNLSSPELAASA